jgi:hypothetical protein
MSSQNFPDFTSCILSEIVVSRCVLRAANVDQSEFMCILFNDFGSSSEDIALNERTNEGILMKHE